MGVLGTHWGSGAQELRNCDFLQIFPVLLKLVSVSVATELLHAGAWRCGEDDLSMV